ncbi:MAG: LysR family transcriptional regulator [Cellulomonas sp.]|jgi:DNA-binding transcriptional LysR family regulator|nr:LysR family transcriptional regulator [Cellulomonas sp.]
MEMRLLRTFVIVSRTGSITKAAVELGYSQPGITHQLKMLERHLGCILFVRDVRPLTLTPVGRRRLAVAEAMLGLERLLRDEVPSRLQDSDSE